MVAGCRDDLETIITRQTRRLAFFFPGRIDNENGDKNNDERARNPRARLAKLPHI